LIGHIQWLRDGIEKSGTPLKRDALPRREIVETYQEIAGRVLAALNLYDN
jgi:hypothetical protein